jgi:hypothetical protein
MRRLNTVVMTLALPAFGSFGLHSCAARHGASSDVPGPDSRAGYRNRDERIPDYAPDNKKNTL